MKLKLTLLSLFVAFAAFAQKDKKLTEETVTKRQIEAHIQFLASDALKGRNTGSEELRIAAEYIRTQLHLYGIKPLPEYPDYLQPVEMEKQFPANEGTIEVAGNQYENAKDFLLINGENREWQGDYVFMEYGTEEQFTSTDVEGKIVVVQCGDGENDSPRAYFGMANEKRKWAKDAGAAGLVELYNSAQLPFSILLGYLGGERIALVEEDENPDEEASEFTHVWINNANNNALKAIKENDETSMSVTIAGKKNEPFTTYNVVGYLPGTDMPDEYVVYSAHYDHVGVGRADSTGDTIYNGARDNAVGTVTVLSAAENIAKYPTNRSSLFIFFTGEEKGLLGSQWYVENSPVDLDKIVYCFNSDGAGYNDTSKATIIGLTRTTAEKTIMEACEEFGLEAIEDQMPEQNLFDRSDNVNFARRGIPAPTFSLGITAFDEEITKYYHQAGDSPESLDYEYLTKFFKAYVYSARLISNLDDAPFWVKGDKYYDAGKELYQK
jgi:hypothetical protein